MTEPTTKPTPANKPDKAEHVTGEVRVPTGDFVLTLQHEEDAIEEFRSHFPDKTLVNVAIVGRTHDVGLGVSYELSADVK